MTNVPGFNTVTIEEATERLIDYRGKTPPKTNSGVRLVTAKVVKGGQIHDEPAEYIAADFYDEWMRRGLPQKLDVLLTTEAPLGEVAILRDDVRIALAQRIILLRAKPGLLDPLYLFYALQSDFGQGELKARASGTTVLGIKQSELRKVRVPIFPLPVQQRIAGILSAYDELIENNQRRIRILEDMARSLYREWFVHFRYPGHESISLVDSPLGQIPQGWEVKKLGDIAEDMRRNIPKGQLNEPQPYVGLEHIPRRSLALDSWENASELGSNKLAFKKGEILFGKIRPYFHKVSIAPFDGLCSADTIVVRARQPEHYSIVVGCVSSDEFVAHATATSNGSKMPRANWSVLVEYPVAIPALAVSRQFSAVVEPAIQQMQTLIFQTANLRCTRDLLLPRLLSGQIDVDATETFIEEAIA
jgi:type I restriction enzyme S subunit